LPRRRSPTDAQRTLGWVQLAHCAAPQPGVGGQRSHRCRGALHNNVWAVGSYRGDDGTWHTLAEHWTGDGWHMELPQDRGASVANYLSGVTAVSPTEIWAVGSYGPGSTPLQTLIERWNGSQWSIMPSANQGSGQNNLNAVVAASPTDIWAVGDHRST